MRRENILAILLVLVLVFVWGTGEVSAEISVGNASHSLSQKYGPGQDIIGWINISVSNENLNSSFQDSLGNIAILKNVLNQNKGFSYSCIPENCENDFSAANPTTSKITSDSPQKYGFLFSGQITSIDSISFSVSSLKGSSIPPSCSSQVEIDFFNDGIIDFSNTNADTDICSGTKTYGCYSQSESAGEYSIEGVNTPYCSKISLPKAPGFRLGAWIKKNSGAETIHMQLFDTNGNSISGGNCALPDASSSGGERSCDVATPIQEAGEYFVCIYSIQGEGGYAIKGYDLQNGCGVYGSPSPSKERVAAYSIFAEAKKYASISSLNVQNYLPSGEYLSNKTKDYIVDRYGSLDCSGNCVVPVIFRTTAGDAEAQQEIDVEVDNVEVRYRKTTGNNILNTIYDLNEVSGKVSFNFSKLYLDSSGLKAKNTTGNFSYDLKLNGKTIFSSEKLSVHETPLIKELSPLSTAYAFPTTFELGTSSPKNISSYRWNFGDNTTETSSASNKTTHTYSSAGNYTVKTFITDKNGISSSKSFQITVTSPKELINTTLTKMQNGISNSTKDIASLGLFERESVERIINITYLSSKIKELQARYNSSNESSYPSLVSEILALKVPDAITSAKRTQDTLLYPERSAIDIGVLQSIGGGNYDYSTENSYRDAVYVWNSQNIKEKTTHEKISGVYSGTAELITNVFSFSITSSQGNYPSYFIIQNLENLKFSKNYNEKISGNYVYIELSQGQNDIVFSTTGNVTLEDIPAFISPGLSNLAIEENVPAPVESSEQTFNWLLYGLVVAALLVILIIVYLALLFWYKNKYESHLFKNKNDLYNLYSFINTQKSKGVSEKDVISKLKNAGWNSEQVRYAIRKYSGRNTGMPLSELIRESRKESREGGR